MSTRSWSFHLPPRARRRTTSAPWSTALFSLRGLHVRGSGSRPGGAGRERDRQRLKPCRAIIADATRPSVRSRGQRVVVCGMTSRGDRRLCGDIISVHVGDPASTVGCVLPFLAPDVPVFLWLPGPLCGDQSSIDELAGAADALITDSRRFDDLRSGIDWLTGHIRRERAVTTWVGNRFGRGESLPPRTSTLPPPGRIRAVVIAGGALFPPGGRSRFPAEPAAAICIVVCRAHGAHDKISFSLRWRGHRHRGRSGRCSGGVEACASRIGASIGTNTGRDRQVRPGYVHHARRDRR